jgi:hypothetical protein
VQTALPNRFACVVCSILHRVPALKAARLGMEVGAQGNQVTPFHQYRLTGGLSIRDNLRMSRQCNPGWL